MSKYKSDDSSSEDYTESITINPSKVLPAIDYYGIIEVVYIIGASGFILGTNWGSNMLMSLLIIFLN